MNKLTEGTEMFNPFYSGGFLQVCCWNKYGIAHFVFSISKL